MKRFLFLSVAMLIWGICFSQPGTLDKSFGNGGRVISTTYMGDVRSRSLSNSLLLSDAAAIKIFPNPVQSTLQIQGLPTDSKSLITIADLSGNVRTSTTATGSNASVSTSSLKPGTYLLKVQSSKRITTQTFIKE